MTYWKVNCMEERFPGLWQSWFMQQTAAIGWPPKSLKRNPDHIAWRMALNAANQITLGDKLIIQLSGSRVGRIGTVVSVRIDEWNPTVPRDKQYPEGEMGRRFDVRWDLSSGPISPSAVARLPAGLNFKGATLRLTLARVPEGLGEQIEAALRDESIWTAVHSRFASERAISEYINEFPHLLEHGLRPYPSAKTREFTFNDKTRSDVLLLNKDDRLVIVECKQNSPTEADLEQLRRYMKFARKEILGGKSGKPIRGILVHGGPTRIHPSVVKAAEGALPVEIVRFAVNVDFASSR